MDARLCERVLGVIDATLFSEADELAGWCDRLGALGLRGTASAAHEQAIALIEAELAELSGVSLAADNYEIARWRPVPEGNLAGAATLSINGAEVPIVGAVPYSCPSQATGPLVYLPRSEAITHENSAGKIVLRDFPRFDRSSNDLIDRSFYRTHDTDQLRDTMFERPGRADLVLHIDLLAAGTSDALGVIFAFDLPRDQMSGYFDPHKGTHYAIPAIYVGGREAQLLKEGELEATIAVNAVVDRAETRSVIATLPGLNERRISIITHTDGNTWVQENGSAAVLAIAKYFSRLPIESRRWTLEFVFTTAHLHISREGAVRHAQMLDDAYDEGKVLCAIAVEHLGVREVVAVPSDEGMRRLEYTGDAEPLLWCVGESPALRSAVRAAISDRGLPRTFAVPGLGPSIAGQIPPIASFGGIGTYYHTALIPTSSVMTGPYTLWAPSFGAGVLDPALYHKQCLAIADVVSTLMSSDASQIGGEYDVYRAARDANEGISGKEAVPPEQASDAPLVRLSPDGYLLRG